MNDKYPLALPEGTVLAGQYIIQKVLGQGGFGITYMAMDHRSGQKVAIKEFFPDTLASRTGNTVSSYPGERTDSFQYGKTCFLQEAETLAAFIGNENIVKIHSYFEENGTAYFVMDFVEGISFDEYIRQKGGKISYDDAERILIHIIDALALVHSKGIVHRDVTPDNIYITKDGTVKLLDFGAARYSLGDKSRSLDVVLKHGFAPKEQYTRHGRQGPFTDVYTVGASFYFAITGKRPPDSIDRLEEDDLVLPSSLGVDIPSQKEDAILKAMSVQPGDRFQTMGEFKQALLGAGSAQNTATASVGVTNQRFFAAPQPEAGSAPAAAQQSLQAQQPVQPTQQSQPVSSAQQSQPVPSAQQVQPTQQRQPASSAQQPQPVPSAQPVQPTQQSQPVPSVQQPQPAQRPASGKSLPSGIQKLADAWTGMQRNTKILIAAAAAVLVLMVGGVAILGSHHETNQENEAPSASDVWQEAGGPDSTPSGGGQGPGAVPSQPSAPSQPSGAVSQHVEILGNTVDNLKNTAAVLEYYGRLYYYGHDRGLCDFDSGTLVPKVAPWGICCVGEYIYYFEGYSGEIHRVHQNGGDPELVLYNDSAAICSFYVTDDYYFPTSLSNGTYWLSRWDISQRAVTMEVELDNEKVITFLNGYVFFVYGNCLYKAPMDGDWSAAQALYQFNADIAVNELSTDGDWIYAIYQKPGVPEEEGFGFVQLSPDSGGEEKSTWTSRAGGYSYSDVVIYDGYLYYVERVRSSDASENYTNLCRMRIAQPAEEVLYTFDGSYAISHLAVLPASAGTSGNAFLSAWLYEENYSGAVLMNLDGSGLQRLE